MFREERSQDELELRLQRRIPTWRSYCLAPLRIWPCLNKTHFLMHFLCFSFNTLSTPYVPVSNTQPPQPLVRFDASLPGTGCIFSMTANKAAKLMKTFDWVLQLKVLTHLVSYLCTSQPPLTLSALGLWIQPHTPALKFFDCDSFDFQTLPDVTHMPGLTLELKG